MREVWGLNPGPVKSAQCGQRLATVATFLRNCVAQALAAETSPATRCTLRCNTASIVNIMKVGQRSDLQIFCFSSDHPVLCYIFVTIPNSLIVVDYCSIIHRMQAED